MFTKKSQVVVFTGLMVGILGFSVVWYSRHNPGAVPFSLLLTLVLVLLIMSVWMKRHFIMIRKEYEGS